MRKSIGPSEETPKHSLTHAMPKAACAVPWSDMDGDDRQRVWRIAAQQFLVDSAITSLPLFLGTKEPFWFLMAAVFIGSDTLGDFVRDKVTLGQLTLIKAALVAVLVGGAYVPLSTLTTGYFVVMPMLVLLHYWHAQKFGIRNRLLEAGKERIRE